jgi:hypothetical protein
MISPSNHKPGADDSAAGLMIFVTFAASVSIVTGAVGLLALVPT